MLFHYVGLSRIIKLLFRVIIIKKFHLILHFFKSICGLEIFDQEIIHFVIASLVYVTLFSITSIICPFIGVLIALLDTLVCIVFVVIEIKQDYILSMLSIHFLVMIAATSESFSSVLEYGAALSRTTNNQTKKKVRILRMGV